MFESIRRLVLTLSFVATALLLVGCGQKGPLYLQSSDLDERTESTVDRVEVESQMLGPSLRRTQEDSGSLFPSR